MSELACLEHTCPRAASGRTELTYCNFLCISNNGAMDIFPSYEYIFHLRAAWNNETRPRVRNNEKPREVRAVFCVLRPSMNGERERALEKNNGGVIALCSTESPLSPSAFSYRIVYSHSIMQTYPYTVYKYTCIRETVTHTCQVSCAVQRCLSV